MPWSNLVKNNLHLTVTTLFTCSCSASCIGKTQRILVNRIIELWISQNFYAFAGQYRSSVDFHNPEIIGKCQLNLYWFSNSRQSLTQLCWFRNSTQSLMQISSRCQRAFFQKRLKQAYRGLHFTVLVTVKVFTVISRKCLVLPSSQFPIAERSTHAPGSCFFPSDVLGQKTACFLQFLSFRKNTYCRFQQLVWDLKW